MPRKRGGQPANKNAFKHGFYSKYFSPFEKKVLSGLPLTDMSGEIGLLRVNIDRFMSAYAASLDQLDYEERLAGLRAITLAVGRIASLGRLLAFVSPDLKADRSFNEWVDRFSREPPPPDESPEKR